MSAGISHSLLGILTLKPMSGYDIEKFVSQNMAYFWKESYGQIYPTLKRMAKLKLVDVRLEKNPGKADRQIYSLTNAGRAEVQAWLTKEAPEPSPRNELILKLFFGASGKPEDFIRHLEDLRLRHRDLLQRYAETEKSLIEDHAGHPGLPYWLITLNYGKKCSQALDEWAEHSVKALKKISKVQKKSWKS